MATQTKTMKVKSDTALAETTTTIRDTVTFDTSKLPNGITYKGLKAVLSFADPIQWNKASTYDSLTVVWDDATHASYASKRPVPQNIELTNEFYWLRTADLDAQVEMYRQEVNELNDRVTANANAIAQEKARAENSEQTLQSNITELAAKTNMNLSVEQLGASPDIDNTEIFKQADALCGIYSTTDTVYPIKGGIEISNDISNVKVTVTKKCDYVFKYSKRDIKFENVSIDGSNLASVGILGTSETPADTDYLASIFKVSVINCVDSCIDTGAVRTIIDNALLKNSKIGVAYSTTDCKGGELVCVDCNTGVKFKSNTYLTSLHAWQLNKNNTKGIDVSDSNFVYISEYIADTVDIAIHSTTNSCSTHISNLTVLNNTNVPGKLKEDSRLVDVFNNKVLLNIDNLIIDITVPVNYYQMTTNERLISINSFRVDKCNNFNPSYNDVTYLGTTDLSYQDTSSLVRITADGADTTKITNLKIKNGVIEGFAYVYYQNVSANNRIIISVNATEYKNLMKPTFSFVTNTSINADSTFTYSDNGKTITLLTKNAITNEGFYIKFSFSV